MCNQTIMLYVKYTGASVSRKHVLWTAVTETLQYIFVNCCHVTGLATVRLIYNLCEYRLSCVACHLA